MSNMDVTMALPEKLPVGEENEGGSLSGRSSPDTNCPICLETPGNKAFTDSCVHQFCYHCLLQWSQIKAECPLCKQRFQRIIFCEPSNGDLKSTYVPQPPPQQLPVNDFVEGLFHLQRFDLQRPREAFRYRTTAVASYFNYFMRLEEAFTNFVIPPGLPTTRHTVDRTGTSEFRRNVYQQGLWAQRTTDVTGSSRECSPEFFRSNEAQIHRLAPWLNRELNVLCNQNGTHIQFVMNDILEMIKYTPIRSPRFADAVAPYFGRHTEHFIHEFYSFASSPYDLVSYDRHANYVGRNNLAHESGDSDVEVLPPPGHSIHLVESDSDDCVVVDTVPAQAAEPEVITLDSSEPENEVVQVNIHIDHNRPGPSHAPIKYNTRQSTQSKDNVSVSIQLGHSSCTRSQSSDSCSSGSLWSQSVAKRKKKYTKKIGSSQNKSLSVRNKIKVDKTKVVLPLKKRRPPPVIESSSSESESDKLVVVTDDSSCSSGWDTSEQKPRLRSVVLKNNVKIEPPVVDTADSSSESSEPPPSESYWSNYNRKYNEKSSRECHIERHNSKKRKRHLSSSNSCSSKEYRSRCKYHTWEVKKTKKRDH